MIVVIGEILIDRFPEYERIGGAPFNFAHHLKQIGWPVRFITRIGDDADGRHILHHMAENQFNLEDVQIDPQRPTGLVKVELDYQGIPQFDICKEVAYDFINFSSVSPIDWSTTQMIYFGSLAQRTRHGFKQYQEVLMRKPDATLGFCDINLRPPHMNREAINASLGKTNILKLNGDELNWIGTHFQGPSSQEDLIAWALKTFGIQLMALTLGDKGSRAITTQQNFSSAAPTLVDNIVDTVGAGDAYAAVLAAGLLKDVPLHRTVELAAEFAAHICTLPGAIPTDDAPYDKLRQQLRKDTS